MTQFHHLIETVGDQGLDMRMQSVDDGCLSVTVFFSDDPSDVCGLSCLVTGPEGLDDAATALVPAISATLEQESVDIDVHDERLEGDLVAAKCSECNNPIVYAGVAVDGVAVCPPCAVRQRQDDRLSLGLSLTVLQASLDEIACNAPDETATELVPVLAEIARLNARLAKEVPV